MPLLLMHEIRRPFLLPWDHAIDIDKIFGRILLDNEIDSVSLSRFNNGICPFCGGHLVHYVVYNPNAGHVPLDICQYATDSPPGCSYGRFGAI